MFWCCELVNAPNGNSYACMLCVCGVNYICFAFIFIFFFQTRALIFFFAFRILNSHKLNKLNTIIIFIITILYSCVAGWSNLYFGTKTSGTAHTHDRASEHDTYFAFAIAYKSMERLVERRSLRIQNHFLSTRFVASVACLYSFLLIYTNFRFHSDVLVFLLINQLKFEMNRNIYVFCFFDWLGKRELWPDRILFAHTHFTISIKQWKKNVMRALTENLIFW